MVLKLDRICVWAFIASIALMLPSIVYVKFLDEFFSYFLGLLAVLDILLNRTFKKYNLLYFLLIFFAFYIIYSVTCVRYNTLKYILMDAIIEIKPFLGYIVFFAVMPSFLPAEKKVVKALCIINVAVCGVLACLGNYYIVMMINHVVYLGATCFICAATYLLVSIDEQSKIPKQDLITVCVFLVVGLSCTRAKYYGEFVLFVFFLFLYKPGMMRKANLKYALMALLVVAVVVAVSWSKISYYFLTGNSSTFDPETMESFARPVLYVTAGQILVDMLPFGSGLASFATYASAQNYSALYHEYGIDKVWGLSEEFGDFICDAYYPSLAQFGVVGVILFFALFMGIYRKLRHLIRCDSVKYKYHFIIGALCICFILIESVAGTLFSQTHGALAMMLIGITAAQVKNSDASHFISANKKTFTIKI